MIAQHDIRHKAGLRPIRYEAVDRALNQLGEKASSIGASVHMRRIGCGLAGGHWTQIEPLVQQHLSRRSVPVTIYDFPAS